MEQSEREELQKQLEDVDGSLVFLALMLFSLFLSWKATALQRQALCRYLAGEEGEFPDVFPLRLPASAIVVGALLYFFGLSLETWQSTRGTGGRAECSANLNFGAAFLVLAAALLRLYDLVCVQERGTGENQVESSAAAADSF